MTPEKLCQGKAKNLLPFAKAVFKLKFSETPDYAKLKHLLSIVLLDENETPGLLFDWSLNQDLFVRNDESIKAGTENVESEADEHMTNQDEVTGLVVEQAYKLTVPEDFIMKHTLETNSSSLVKKELG
jgi:hypothetical protein